MERLKNRIRELLSRDLVVAFSGGVDSSVILKIACDESKKVNKRVFAVTFETKLHPACDLENAESIAREIGAVHHVIKVNELENIDIKNNPVDRCYRCKHYLFSTLVEFAKGLEVNDIATLDSDVNLKSKLESELGFVSKQECEFESSSDFNFSSHSGLKSSSNLKANFRFDLSSVYILDGTNFDDLSEYRPGLKALSELGIISPLAELGIKKEEVRAFAKELGMAVSNRPSAPCLATRLPYGTELNFELLARVDQGEEFLKSLGFDVNRIRVHGNIARVEIKNDQFDLFIGESTKIIEKLKALGFIYVTLDIEGFRSGSMDI